MHDITFRRRRDRVYSTEGSPQMRRAQSGMSVMEQLNEEGPVEEAVPLANVQFQRSRRATTGGAKLEVTCMMAKTALLLPFTWDSPTSAESKKFVSEMLARKIVDDALDEVPLWEPSVLLPAAVADLDPNFRYHLGWKETEQATHLRLKSKTMKAGGGYYQNEATTDDDVCRRIRLTDSAMRILFHRPSLVARETAAATQKTGYNMNTSAKDSKARFATVVMRDVMSKSEASKDTPATSEGVANKVEGKEPIKDNVPTDSATTNKDDVPTDSPTPKAKEEAPKDGVKDESSKDSSGGASKENSAKEAPCTLIYQPVKIEKVEIVVFPLGTAVLTIHINWITSESRKVGPMDGPPIGTPSMEELRTWLFLSKFRHKILNVFDGWTLNDHPDEQKVSLQDSEKHPLFKYYGKHVLRALFYNKPCSLSAIGNFLISPPSVAGAPYTTTLDRSSTRCYHHTLAVLANKPLNHLLQEYLFHLRRAFGQTNRPPPADLEGLVVENEVDVIIQPRQNRYIGLSREGTVSISWPNKDSDFNSDYEFKKWHKDFFNVFLIFAIHVQGERSVLLELSLLSSNAGNLLKKLAKQHREKSLDLQDVDHVRERLSQLATLMTRYTLQMSTDECGGLSDHLEFFSSLRKIFDIRIQRLELSEEIDDVLKLVETTYLQQQQEASVLAMELRKAENKLERQREKRKTRRGNRFQLAAGVLATIALPIIAICGLLGVNLVDVPRTPPFFQVIGFSIGMSVLFTILMLLVPKPKKKKEEKVAKKTVKGYFKASKKKSTTQRGSRAPFWKKSVASQSISVQGLSSNSVTEEPSDSEAATTGTINKQTESSRMSVNSERRMVF